AAECVYRFASRTQRPIHFNYANRSRGAARVGEARSVSVSQSERKRTPRPHLFNYAKRLPLRSRGAAECVYLSLKYTKRHN
ncbi:MAG: hypothetical protein LBH47_03820, partial [Christensenellaceae bacterium]|nr:hypothetical protein [Christensenellaceae bacterium]